MADKRGRPSKYTYVSLTSLGIKIPQRVVYGLVDPRDWSIFYVGKTVDILRRFRDHNLNLVDIFNSPQKAKRVEEIHQLGLEIYLRILEEVQSSQDLASRELFWIDLGFSLGWPLTNKLGEERVNDLVRQEDLDRYLKFLILPPKP